MPISYYILDTETTGLKHDFHDITEISVIRYDDRMQIFRKVKARNPSNASFDALRITGKTTSDLYKGMESSDMVSEINDFFSQDALTPAHRCIVAHNAGFDRGFLHSAWSINNSIFPADLWLDTLQLAKKIAKSRGIVKTASQRFNLQASCDLFGIKKIANAHNAKDDARNTYLLLNHFIENNEDLIDSIKRIPHLKEEENNNNNDIY